MSTKRRVVFLIPNHIQLMDVAGPAQVFTNASELGAPFELSFYSELTHAPSHQGLMLQAQGDIPHLRQEDLLMIPGWKTEKTSQPLGRESLELIKTHAQQDGEIVSICAGSLILAKLGILWGRRAITHHDLVEKLEKYSHVKVIKDVLYTCDKNFHTSAGIASGIDLALHLVARDCGPALAAQVARTILVPAWRPGAGSQVSIMLRHRNHMDDVVHRAQDILDDPSAGVVSLEQLGKRLGVSARTLSRHFVAAVGMTPFAYGDAVRLEHIQLLRSQGLSAEQVAREVGYADGRSLRKRK